MMAKYKTVAELEAALNSVVEQLNMGMIRPRHGKRLMQMYWRQLERKGRDGNVLLDMVCGIYGNDGLRMAHGRGDEIMIECDECICQDCPKRTEAIPTGVCGMCDACERRGKRVKNESSFCVWKGEKSNG